MDISKPFDHESFRAWYTDVIGHGGQLSIAVKFDNETTQIMGDPKLGVDMLTGHIQKQKRASMNWLGDPSQLKKLRVPIRDGLKSGFYLYLNFFFIGYQFCKS